jgi:hypothetical protein
MRDGTNSSYVLLNVDEVKKLFHIFNYLKHSSMLEYRLLEKIYIQEWQDFPYEKQIKHIGNINPEEATIEKLAKNCGLTVDALKEALAILN